MKVNRLVGKAAIAIRYSTAGIVVLEGSVRSGKTIGSLIEWARFIRNGPAGNLLMVGRTERTLINNLLIPMQEMFGRGRVIINSGSGTATIFGRTVFLVGANNEQARTKIQGLTLAGAYVDEAATIPESFWNMLVSRMSIEGARIYATCNPEGPRHWFLTKWLKRAKLWIDGPGRVHDRRAEYHHAQARIEAGEQVDDAPIDLHRISFTLDDNAHNLPPKYLASTKASYSGLFYQRFILGRWALADGVIYDGFDQTRHVVPASQLPPIERVLGMGIDYGTTNPTRGILVGLAGGKLHALDEWAPGRGTDADLSADLASWLEARPQWTPEYLYVDPAAASFKLQLYRDRVGRVENGQNAVVDGIRTVASLIGSDRLLIADTCTSLLEELPGYVWDVKASEKGEDRPVKLDDHSCDALRYGIATTESLWARHIAAPAA